MTSGPRLLKVLAAAVMAAPLPMAGYASEYNTGPAVSGFNTKLSGEGGIYDDESAGLAQGSITTPLGHSLGFQIDGALGSVDGDTLGGAGAHLFTRDPSRYLLGLYGSYHTWNSIDIWRLGAEGELYLGRTTLSGVAGWESVDVPATVGGLAVINQDDDHFFTEVDLSYYPTDNLRLTGGYHYENEQSLGSAQIEYMPRWSGVPMSLFANGNFGDEDHTRITGGLRFYFGADRGKSLIRRHREDDPGTYTPTFPNLTTTTGGGTNFCPVDVEIPDGDGCTCPAGSEFSDFKEGGFVCSTGGEN